MKRLIATCLPVLGIAVSLALSSPLARLLMATLGLLGLLKISYAFVAGRRLPWAGWLLYLVWPGFDIEAFQKREAPDVTQGPRFVKGFLLTWIGLAALVGLSLFADRLPLWSLRWGGAAAFLTTIHFGLCNLFSGALRLAGWKVRPLFESPLKSRSLREFWSRRWNLAFVEMNRRLFLPAFRPRLGKAAALFAAFALSGLLHEVAISGPVRAGYGGPLAYFLMQGALVLWVRVESPALVWAAVLVPLPLLFPTAFLDGTIVKSLVTAHGALTGHSIPYYLDKGLWLAGICHFIVLCAAVQIPFRLKWREELPRLSSLNRKLMCVYGAYIFSFIVALGAFTLHFRSAMIEGNGVALAVATFLFFFWSGRILIDGFFFKHSDWPSGAQFVVGHTLLTFAFTYMTIAYGSLVVWRLWS